MTDRPTFGVLGATSPAGEQAVRSLVRDGYPVVAFSRSRRDDARDSGAAWVSLGDDLATIEASVGTISVWIALCPVWVLSEHFELLSRLGARRIVCLSSTSQFTKAPSQNAYEAEVVDRLTEGEAAVTTWAEDAGIGWTVLRPTLIYGRGTDRNLAEIVRIIRKARLFPLFGPARGLRQPIYVDDVATASIQAARSPQAVNRSYNLSGGEVLSYREMIVRIFRAMNLKPRLVTVPIWVFNLALALLRLLPRYRNWNSEMVQRMSLDMVFDHKDASRDFGFDPRPFELSAADLVVPGASPA
jgi:nucleoside-diphosphate-sugar epimerase